MDKRRVSVSLCLLTLNEKEGCEHDVPLIDRYRFDDIYAVDGGSTDGTIEYLRQQGIPVHIQPRKGMNAACSFAFSLCKSDALVFFHPKATVPVNDTLKFRRYFEEGFQLIIASRNIAGGVNEEDTRFIKLRKWATTVFALAIAFLWKREGPRIRDILHGFRGMTIEAFNRIRLQPSGISVDIEMVSKAYKHRLKRIEFPTKEKARPYGMTHFKALPCGIQYMKYIIRELSGKA
jgi:hypothetical protein